MQMQSQCTIILPLYKIEASQEAFSKSNKKKSQKEAKSIRLKHKRMEQALQ